MINTENMIKESKETNKRLKNQLVVAQLQKQSLFRAVNYYIEKENPQLSEEYKKDNYLY